MGKMRGTERQISKIGEGQKGRWTNRLRSRKAKRGKKQNDRGAESH